MFAQFYQNIILKNPKSISVRSGPVVSVEARLSLYMGGLVVVYEFRPILPIFTSKRTLTGKPVR